MLSIVLWALVISLVINSIFFAIAFNLQTDKFTDITYSLSFILIAIYAYLHSDYHRFETIGFILVIIWAVRLGGFLLYRVIKKGKDGRFDAMRGNFKSFAKFWIGQAVVAWALMIPAILAFSGDKNFSSFSIIGAVIWLIGLVIESIADFQKFNFGLNLSNKGKWIDRGIWHYSRHPNYFGEMLIWIGIYIFAFPVLGPLAKLVGLASPILIIVLLRYGSGIPILEKSADKKWGEDPKYVEFKKKTNLLIPFFK